MTKDTGVFRQFRSVACCEYTLPRDDKASQPKGWIQGNMRNGLVLEVTTSFQHFKYGIEIRIKSVNQDDSHSLVRRIDIEPSEQTLIAYQVSKKVISLLRHNQTLQREEDGAIEFYRIKFYLRSRSSQVQHWSDERWKACLAAGGGSKRRYQYCSDNLGTIIYLHALQGHSGN